MDKFEFADKCIKRNKLHKKDFHFISLLGAGSFGKVYKVKFVDS